MEFFRKISTCSFAEGVITMVRIPFGVEAADIAWGCGYV